MATWPGSCTIQGALGKWKVSKLGSLLDVDALVSKGSRWQPSYVRASTTLVTSALRAATLFRSSCCRARRSFCESGMMAKLSAQHCASDHTCIYGCRPSHPKETAVFPALSLHVAFHYPYRQLAPCHSQSSSEPCDDATIIAVIIFCFQTSQDSPRPQGFGRARAKDSREPQVDPLHQRYQVPSGGARDLQGACTLYLPTSLYRHADGLTAFCVLIEHAY